MKGRPAVPLWVVAHFDTPPLADAADPGTFDTDGVHVDPGPLVPSAVEPAHGLFFTSIRARGKSDPGAIMEDFPVAHT